VALSVAITLVTDRPWWERLVIIASSVPIAVASNIIRITITSLLYMLVNQMGWPEWVEKFFHDFDGLLMMPMGLGMLYVEFQILSHLVIDEGDAGPLSIGTPAAAAR
jgi:exosortase/archaeosortase family protein